MFNHTSAVTGVDKIAYITTEPRLGWTIICFFDAHAVSSVALAIFIALFPTVSGIILASVLMIIIVSRSLQPLKPLAAAAGQVAQGNLDVRFEIRQNDEISQVSKAFLEIVRTLSILQDGFNKAESSMMSGDTEYRLEDARLGGVYGEMFTSTNNIVRYVQSTAIQLKEALEKAEDATRA
jgi:methyl-accepting chemotaxis protein